MRKLTFIIACFLYTTLLYAQNGFESVDPGIEFSKYAIDQDGNYWFHTDEKIYKYNEADSIVEYSESNTNLVYTDIIDIIVYESNIYIVTKSQVYEFNTDDPMQCVDLGFEGLISSAFYSNGRLFLFSNQPGEIVIYLYNGVAWKEADPLPTNNYVIEAVYFNDKYYYIQSDGLTSYDGEQFDFITDIVLTDMHIWSGVLWLASSEGIYYLSNDTVQLRVESSGYYGGTDLAVMNGELWSGATRNDTYYFMNRIGIDSILYFSLPREFNCFPNCNPDHEAVELAIGNKLYTFNENEYVPSPTIPTPENTKNLSVNNVDAAYQTLNSFFKGLNGSQYKVPKEGEASSFSLGSFWFGGKDPDEELHVSAESFIKIVSRPGPLRLDNHLIDPEVMRQFNRIWKLDRATIENFKYRYENGEVQNGNYPIDYEIATWPANGPEGYAENLAPFIDVNEDGIYNPMDGDYPDIEGDQMLYWIVNDNSGYRDFALDYSPVPHLGLEIHFKAWANVYEGADTDALEAINNATFLDVEIVNRSDTTYTDFYTAFWTDGGLGYSNDDYIGCDVMNNSYYYYNGDENDEGDEDTPGYGLNPPAQSVTFLNAPIRDTAQNADTGSYMSSFICESLGGECNIFGDEFYNYMMGHWKDGTEITYGGNGINSTDIACKYMFPGDSDPYNIGTNGVAVPDWDGVWTMSSGGYGPRDVRGVASNGPYTLEPGQTVKYRFAFVWARDTVGGTAAASLDKLRELLPYFQQWQREGEFPSNYNIHIVPIGINEQPASALGVKLYPNPTNNTVTLTCDAANAHYKIYSLSGRLMKEGQIRNKLQQISLDYINPGLYVVQITNGNISTTKKLIIE